MLRVHSFSYAHMWYQSAKTCLSHTLLPVSVMICLLNQLQLMFGTPQYFLFRTEWLNIFIDFLCYFFLVAELKGLLAKIYYMSHNLLVAIVNIISHAHAPNRSSHRFTLLLGVWVRLDLWDLKNMEPVKLSLYWFWKFLNLQKLTTTELAILDNCVNLQKKKFCFTNFTISCK